MAFLTEDNKSPGLFRILGFHVSITKTADIRMPYFSGRLLPQVLRQDQQPAEGRAAPGSTLFRFFPAQGTGAGMEPGPLHPMAQNTDDLSQIHYRKII